MTGASDHYMDPTGKKRAAFQKIKDLLSMMPDNAKIEEVIVSLDVITRIIDNPESVHLMPDEPER